MQYLSIRPPHEVGGARSIKSWPDYHTLIDIQPGVPSVGKSNGPASGLSLSACTRDGCMRETVLAKYRTSTASIMPDDIGVLTVGAGSYSQLK